ncbi:VCBS domain-containing protein [Aeromonas dhakensis]
MITGTDIGGVTEDESNPTLTETGTLTVSDVDGADEAKFVAGNGTPSAGALGSLSITEGGTWTYNVDNSKVQYLGEGETKVETLWSSPWMAPPTPSPSPSPASTMPR